MAEINEYAQQQIDKIKELCKRIKPLVVIHCITYNHEPYIKDALDGFIMQKTDFPFVAIVHEDVSTDKTAEIVKEYSEKYPDIILPIFEKENQYSKGTLSKVMDEACHATGAKYIAMCEGDDYWIDPQKLQRQITFLETNEEYSACLTKFKRYNQKTDEFLAVVGHEYHSLKDMLFKDLHFATASLVMRSRLNKSYTEDIQPYNKNWLMGDKPLVLYMGAVGRVKTLPQCTTVYRILEESASHSTDISLQLKRARNTIDIYQYFADNFLPKNPILSEQLEGGYLFRAYKIYREVNTSLPQNIKTKILNYKGAYSKLHLIKIFIRVPILANLAYKISFYKNNTLAFFQK